MAWMRPGRSVHDTVSTYSVPGATVAAAMIWMLLFLTRRLGHVARGRVAFLAAATALRMTHTSVTGPIPPGTGVMDRPRRAVLGFDQPGHAGRDDEDIGTAGMQAEPARAAGPLINRLHRRLPGVSQGHGRLAGGFGTAQDGDQR